MDFSLTLITAVYLAAAITVVAAATYGRRLWQIRDALSTPTYRALAWFGMAGLALVFTAVVGVLMPSLDFVAYGLVYALLLVASLNLVITDTRRLKWAVGAVHTVLVVLGVSWLLSPLHDLLVLQMLSLTGLFVACVVVGIVFLRASPSMVSVSNLAVAIVTLISWVYVRSGLRDMHPEYFLLLVLPVSMVASMMFSIRRPWRRTITYFIVITMTLNGIALLVPAASDGQTEIATYAALSMVVGLTMGLPLDYFIYQAVSTRARTPIYISMTLAGTAMLVMTHCVNYAIAHSHIGYWDSWIMFVDWVLGLFAVLSFIVAGVAASFSPSVRNAAREVMIVVGFVMATLGLPSLRFQEHKGTMYEVWNLNSLYPVMLVLIGIGFLVFFRVMYQLWKQGALGVAARFMAFMVGSLSLGLVAMFADVFGIEVLTILVVGACVLLFVVSPHSLDIFRRSHGEHAA